MFVRSLERARLRKCGNQARLLGELLARRAGGVGFGVTRLRDGRRTATIGAAPDGLTNFSGTPGSLGVGPLWRVADVTTHVAGGVTSCTVDVLHPPGSNTGFDVTVDDPRY